MQILSVSTAPNIVGYQQITIKKGEWALYTPTFKGVSTTLKLGDITVCNPAGLEYDDNKGTPPVGRCRGAVKVYKMNTSSGNLGAVMAYTSNGWENRTTTKIETWGWGAYRNETIGGKECLVVVNGHTEDVNFRVSGEVVLKPMVEVPSGMWGVIGNNTPVDRVLGDFMVCNPNGDEYDDNKGTPPVGRCRGVVKVYKMNTSSGNLGAVMAYTSNGWENRTTTKIETWGWGAYRNEPVNAGEALVIINGHSENVQLKLKGPLEN